MSARRLPPARSLNPMPVGLAFIALIAVLVYFAFNLGKVPFVGGGTSYSAAFAEAAGLRAGNDVRVGGVKVGEVEQVSLEGTHVRVDFTVEQARLGEDTRALIDIGTLLGNKYLTIQPAGPGSWDPDEQLPLSRTTSPYDIVPAFAELTGTVQEIDTAQLAQAFTTLADTFRDAPPDVQGALDGLTRLSLTISSRDEALTELLDHAQGLTGVLADSRTQLTRVMGDGSLLLTELDARQEAIHRLLVETAALADQLSGLVDDNQAVIGPALEQLRSVTQILADNDAQLEESLKLLYPTTRNLINAVGTGAWYDAIVQNLIPVPDLPLGLGLPDVVPLVPRTVGDLLATPLTAAP